ETNFLINRDITAKTLFERIRHGDGDIMTPHQKADGTRKSFLSGIVEKQHRWGVSITDQILRDVFLTLQINRIDFQNFNQIKGKRARDHRIVFKLTGNW
ncbi:MAG: hypothetical protein SCK70_14205, partial [bacterium]|nr:hypothetical protein [bacterium]